MNKLCEVLNKSYSSYPPPLLSPPSSSAALTTAKNVLSAQLLQLRRINPTPWPLPGWRFGVLRGVLRGMLGIRLKDPFRCQTLRWNNGWRKNERIGRFFIKRASQMK